MPFHPIGNPDLAAILMAQGIQKLGEGIGEAAGGIMGGMGKSQEASGFKAALTTGSEGGMDLGGMEGTGGGTDFWGQLKSFGLSDEQIAKYKQYLANAGSFQNYTGPRDFGIGN